MNPAQVLAYFDRLTEAPNAVPRLRKFILDLAVRGKLVEQDSNDNCAEQRINNTLIAKKETITTTDLSEQPYFLPDSWKWVHLGDRLKMINGRAFKPTDWLQVGLPIIRIQNLNNENAPFNYCDPKTIEPRHVIHSDDFLISWSGTPGTSFGAFIWQRGKAALNQHIFKCLQIGDEYYDRFLQIAINGRLDEMIAKAHGGVGLQHITKGKLENLLLSLPTLAEQHRIVAKVDELMGLCDQLEAAQAQRERRRDRLMAASLNRLNWPDGDAKAFRAHARFHLAHLPRFTVRPDQIPALRQTILNLAAHGRLISQDPTDESAAELLEKITGTKRRLVAQRKLRVTKELEPMTDGEILFNLPVRWCRTRLGAVYDVRDGTHDTPKYAETGYPLITSKNLSSGRLSFDDVKLISEQDHRQISERSTVERDDILLAMIGSIGNPVLVDTDRPFSIKNVALFKYYDRELSCPGFLCLFLQYATGEMRQLAAGGLQPFVSLGFLRNFPIILPPLAEQHRIVAKVDELMAVCDRLEAQLTTTQTESRRLLEAVLHEALAPAPALLPSKAIKEEL
ncbi:MAG: restriction endonuclease subunit S [Planctomycetota bacterium]